MIPIFKKYPLLTFALFAILGSLYCANSAVIGLDLGGEYMKISSISPGKSFTIVEDTTTKRKTPTAIGFHSNERVYEYDILAKRPRSFQTIFTNIVKYLGKSPNDPKLQEQIKYYMEDYQIVENERGTISFKVKNFKMSDNDDTNYILKVEEIFGMIFRHIKKLASEQAERQLRDIAVTVPPYWNFKERYALHDALLLADLNPLAFISENTAAALYYALERQDEKTHTMIMYNLGSTSLKVSLIEFYLQNSTDKADKGTPIETFRVLAEAWEEDVGGLSFDLGLTRHFAKEFDSKPARKGQKSVLSSNPAKAKLLKESNRLKEILSANKQVQLFLENLFDSTDLKSPLDRNTLEEVNKDVLAKLTKPIDEVLTKSGKTLADIDAFELIGGGVRVPRIQQILSEYLQGKEVGTHLNGDESATLGASFHAANLSSSFKTRQLYINDGYNFDIRVELRDLEPERLANNEEGASKLEKQAVLFPYKTRFGSKKVLAFEYDGDINATFYAKLTGQETEENVISFEITGLKEAREDPKLQGKDLNPPKIHLHFRLSPLGFIELGKAEAVIEEIVLYEDTAKNTTEKTTKTDTAEPTDTESGETSAETTADESQEPEKKFKRKTITHTIPLKVNIIYPKPGPMTEEERELSRDILSKFDHYEQQKRKTAEAKNRLEAFLYSTRDSLEEEGFVVSAKDEEKEKLHQLLEEHSEWLGSDEAYKANHLPFQKRFDEMNNVVSKIQHRFEQRVKRPEAVEKARTYLKDFISKIGEVNLTKPWITSEAISDAVQQIENIGHWITEQLEKQELLAHHEDPVLTTHLLVSKLDKAKDIYTKLKNTVKPKPPKNGTSTDEEPQFQDFMGKDGKFDEEKLKEYFKKMNITYDGSKFKKDGEETPKDETTTDKPESDQSEKTTNEEPKEESKDEKPIDTDL